MMSNPNVTEDSEISLLITHCFDSTNDFFSIKQLLNSYKHNLLFRHDSDKITRLIGIINTNLNKQVTNRFRFNALIVLDDLLPYCNVDIFTENASFWLQCCLKSSDSDPYRCAELELLEKLVLSSVNYPDIRRHASHILPDFMDGIKFSTRVEVTYKKVKCLIAYLNHFSEACGSSTTRIVSFLNDVLKTHTNKKLLKICARCYTMTSQCGQRGKGNVNYVTNWTQQYNYLVNTLNHVMNDIVNNVSMESCDEAGQICSGLLDNSYLTQSNVTVKYFILLSNFKRISEVISAMFRTSSSTMKMFDPRDLIRLIHRVANFNMKTLSTFTETNDTLAMKIVLPQIHESNFRTLRALIKCANRNLIPYGPMLGAICVQSLESSRFESGSTEVLYRNIRKNAYKTLSTWFTVAGSSSSVESVPGNLTREIQFDVVGDREDLVLLNKEKRNNTKSKNSNAAKNLIGQKDLCYVDDPLKIAVCVEAHKTLQNYIKYAVQSNVKQYEELQNAIYSQVTALLPDKTTLEIGNLYSNNACRLKLYESLYVLIMEPPPDYTTHIADGIHLFTNGMLDHCIEISCFCSSSLTVLRTIIHPRAPTLSISKQIISNASDGAANDSYGFDNIIPIFNDGSPEDAVPISIENEVDVNNAKDDNKNMAESSLENVVRKSNDVISVGEQCELENIVNGDVTVSKKAGEDRTASADTEFISCNDNIAKRANDSDNKAENVEDIVMEAVVESVINDSNTQKDGDLSIEEMLNDFVDVVHYD